VPAAMGRSEAARGQVFLLRGLINVFSFGMDTLGRKIRAKDIPARVTNFTNWRGYAAVLLDKYRDDKSLEPFVIIGHSLGADAAIDMGNYLAQHGMPVRLIVAFDGVHAGHKVGPGIAEVINYYKSDGVGKTIEAGPGFKGKLANVDVSDRPNIDHLNIEKSPELHAEVVAKLAGIFPPSD
jgi:pimeloyl-ACP methyl ester carboxylesterase